MKYILDTNIVSAIMKSNFQIKQKMTDLKLENEKIFISCITYFEIKRGLLYANAKRKLEIFEKLSQKYEIIFIEDLPIIEKSSEIYANLKKRGLPIQTEDILIAATAIVNGLILVSNDSDLTRIEGLQLENWLN